MASREQPGNLPGTDEFIEKCERVRAWNYVVRAAAQAQLSTPVEPAGTATFAGAQVWFTGRRARVHLLTDSSLDRLPAIEAWLGERKLTALFDVLPTLSSRPVTLALAERGYHLVAWQPLLYRELLYRELSSPLAARHESVEVREIQGENPEFRDTFLAGYEVPWDELGTAARVFEDRWRAEGARRFIARIDDKPIAAATLVVFDGVARLANCATLPRARNLGAQSALIRARLRCVENAGLKLAISDARQGGGSLRNLARAGFAVCAQITQWSRV